MDNIPADKATREQLTTAVNLWRTKRQARLDAEKEAEKLKVDEDALKNWIISVIRDQRYEAIVTGGRITGLSVTPTPQVIDREKLTTHIITTGEIELLQFRLAVGAVNERKDNNILVPGVNFFDHYDLFDRKMK